MRNPPVFEVVQCEVRTEPDGAIVQRITTPAGACFDFRFPTNGAALQAGHALENAFIKSEGIES